MASESLFNENSKDVATIPVPSMADIGATPGTSAGLLTHPKLFWILQQVQQAEPKVNKWREMARQCYSFIANRQLNEEDERILRQDKRPHTALNTTQKFIRYISGVQRDSYLSLLFNSVALENDRAQLFGERIQQYYSWACKHSNADNKRSRAFEDFLITGMGWTSCYISRAKDPRGLVGYDRLNPLEMLWPDVGEVNLDAEHCRWRGREAWIENEEAKALFPTKEAHWLIDYAAAAAPALQWPSVDIVPYKIPYVQSYPLDRLRASKQKKNKSRILEFQWWDNEAVYVFEDPLDNTEQSMSEAEFWTYQEALADENLPEVEHYDRQIGRAYHKAFILNRKFLLEPPSPLAGSRFGFNPICCHFDEDERFWYGFMRVMMDPQRYINKFFNQMLESFGKQSKGGAIVESGAFDDQGQADDFKATYAQTGSVNFVAEGGINKIKEKTQPQTPAAAMAIMQFVITAMGDTITGINADTLGLGASTTPGVTLKRRQRAGMVLLAAEFDAETQWRIEEGQIVYDYLKLISDDRLIRVVGGMGDSVIGGQVVKLEDAPFSLEYEIAVDEAEERDPMSRQYLAELLMGPFGQTLLRMNKFLPMFVRALPIPRTWAMGIEQAMNQEKEMIQKLQMAGMPMPGGRGQQKGVAQIQAEVAEKQARAALEQAKAKRLLGQSGTDLLKLLMDGLQKGEQARRDRQEHGLKLSTGVVDMMSQMRDIGSGTEGGE